MADMSKGSIHTSDHKQKDSTEDSEGQRKLFSYHTNRLITKSRFLRLLGFCIFSFSLFGVIFSLVPQQFSAYFSKDVANIAIFATVAVAVMAMCLIVAYEYQCRVGRALFEEISDEFQWRKHDKRGDMLPDEELDESAPLDARLALREFARTIDLPLVPGRFGPGIYMLINIIAIANTIIGAELMTNLP